MKIKKTLSQKYIEYIAKNKIIKKNRIPNNANIEKIISTSIINSLRTTNTHSLKDFGYLKKTISNDNNKQISIELINDPNTESKICANYVRKQKEIENNKKTKIFIALSIITFFITLVFLFGSFLASDMFSLLINPKRIIDNKKIITHPKRLIDSEKIIVEKDLLKDPNLKQGEYKKKETIIGNITYLKYTYAIKKGDTLWKISKKFLKDSHAWHEIEKHNEDITNPHLIYENDQLSIYIIKEKYNDQNTNDDILEQYR